jgi:hypothetical protein
LGEVSFVHVEDATGGNMPSSTRLIGDVKKDERSPVFGRGSVLLNRAQMGEQDKVTLNLRRANTKSVGAQRLTLFAVLSVIAVIGSPVVAQTTATWTGGAGAWSPCPNQQGTALWDTCNLRPPVYPNGNYNAVIQGGPVSGTGAAVVNLTIGTGDTLLLNPGYLEVTGPNIVNNGSISIGNSNGLIIGGIGVTTTLSGSGSVRMTNSGSRFVGASGNGAGLIIQQMVQGQGQLGLENLVITNQNTISASGGTLTVYPSAGLTNTGTMQATSGSTLTLVAGFSSIPFNNTGGTIQALSGGTVLLNGGTFSGGTFTTKGTGYIQTLSYMNNITNTGLMKIPGPTGPTTVFEGAINNAASIQSLGTIYFNGSTTLSGAGTLAMSGVSADMKALNGPADTLFNQQLIHGSGNFFALPLTNQGTIRADDPLTPLTFGSQSLGATPTTNTSILEASGGATLQIGVYVNNSGGTIEALTGSTVILTASSSVNGGTLATAGTGVIETQNALLDGTVHTPTNAGVLKVGAGTSLNVKGTINNNGTIALDPTGGCVALNAATTLTGAGQITMSGPSDCIFAGSSTDTFTNQSMITGMGSVGDSNPMTVVNKGTIVANGGLLTIVGGGTGFTNIGRLYVNPGSSLNITGVFKSFNHTTNTLSGGTYTLAGPLSFPNANIVTKTGTLTLAGAAAEIVNSTTLTNALLNFAVNKGSLSLTLGQKLTTVASLTNYGKVTVDGTSSFAVGGNYTQAAGTTTIDGTLTVPGFNLNAGSLFGAGTIAGSLTSGASVTAGDSAVKTAKLSVRTYSQEAAGSLNIGIGGLALGTKYGQLASANGVSLAGTLNLKRLGGFVPAIGSSFTIVTGSALSGKFTTTNGLSINSAEHFQVNYTSTAVTVTVVSGP